MAHLSYSPAVAVGSFVHEIAKIEPIVNQTGGFDDERLQLTCKVIKEAMGISENQVLFRFLLLISKANMKMIKLLDDTEILMHKDEYRESFVKVSKLIQPEKLSNRWDHSKRNYLTNQDLSNVMAGCNIIGTLADRINIPDVDIDNFIDKIKELKEEVSASDVDDFVKEFVNDDLDFLIYAINKFIFIGPPGVQMVFGNLTSSLYCNDEILRSSWAKKLGAVLLVAATMLGVVADLDAVSEILSDKSKKIVELLTHRETKLLEDFSKRQ